MLLMEKQIIKPEPFVINPRHIAQGQYILNPMAQRLLKMAQRKFDFKNPNNREVKFSVNEFLQAFNLSKTVDRAELKDAFPELRKAGVDIREDLPDGGFHYEGFNFFEKVSSYWWSWGMDEITVKFTETMAVVMAEYEESGYQLLDLAKVGKLTGKYEIRFYEIAMSRYNQRDLKTGEWWFDYSLKEIRDLLKVGGKYPNAGNFKIRVIDGPLMRLNNANIGIQINTLTPKRMTKGNKIRFLCRCVTVENPKSTEPQVPTEELRNAFPEEWDRYKAEAFSSKEKPRFLEGFPDSQGFVITWAEGQADQKLSEAHPDFFKKEKKHGSKRI